jgi:hypothetical protein
MVQAKSFDEVMEWMKRCPALHEDGAEIEIRPSPVKITNTSVRNAIWAYDPVGAALQVTMLDSAASTRCRESP